MEHWHLLHINPNLGEIFQNPPILAFCQNKNLRDIIGTKLIENSKVKTKFTNKIQGKCTPCLANNRTLCCKQVVHTTMFRSNQMNRICQIYHNLNCKSKYVTTERMYGNQMLYLHAAIFQAKAITSTHMQDSYWLNRYSTLTLTNKKKERKAKAKKKLLDINTRHTNT